MGRSVGRSVGRSIGSYRRAPLVVSLLLRQLLLAGRLVGHRVLRETGSGVLGGAYTTQKKTKTRQVKKHKPIDAKKKANGK